MEIKQLDFSHFDDFLELEGYAFHYLAKEGRVENAKKVWENAIILGAFSDEGAIQSALSLRPYDVYFYGKTIGMGGIGDVASYPEARGQGNIRRLVKEAFEIMREKKMLVSYLMPFSYPFYRQFGYELVFEKRSYTILPSEFNPLETGRHSVRRVDWEEEKEAIMSLYEAKYEDGVGPVNRKEWAWEEKKRWVADSHIALCVDEEGRPAGYVFYHFESKQRPYVFAVDEMVALSGDAEKALWQFIGSHRPQFDRFTYQTGRLYNLAYLFKSTRVEQKLVPGMMARIVDMEAFLKEFPFRSDAAGTYWLNVFEDKSAEWNNGTYKVELGENGTTVTKVAEGTGIDGPLIEGTIQAWTQLFMGSRTAKQLRFIGNLHTDKETAAAFQDALPAGTPELYDHF